MKSEPTFEVTKDYRTALRNFWQGRYHTALENLTNALGSDTDHENRFNLYRLWIEILADQHDYKALDELHSHLLFRSIVAPQDKPVYVALRGLIHLERDEIKLAQLHIDTLQKTTANDYSSELKIRLGFRLNESVDFPRNTSMIDYCSIKNVATVLWHEEHSKALKSQENTLKKFYTDSPLIPVLEMHEAFMTDDFEGAFTASKELYEAYPSHADYLVMNAWSAIKTKRYSEAEAVLENFVSQSSDDDIDVLSLLSSLYQKLYETTQEKKYKQASIKYSKKSQAWLENNSMDATVEKFYSQILESENAKQKDFNHRAILFCIDARSSFEVSELSQQDFSSFKITSNSPLSVGDIVFMCSRNLSDTKKWRLVASARITSEANWTPMNTYESSALGLCRPEFAPKLTLNFPENDLTLNSPIELSGDALDYMIESVKEQIDDADMNKDFSQVLQLLSA